MADRSPPGVDNSEAVNRAGNIGAGAQISGNVHQEFHVTSGGGTGGRWYPVKDLFLPIIVGLVVAVVGGAWGKTKFDIATAPERTVAYSQNLITLSNEALKLHTAQPTSPDLTAKLQEIASQARAVEAAAAFLGDSTKLGAQRPDFWLRPGGGGIRLGESASFGIRSVDPNGNLAITLNNTPRSLLSGGFVDFVSEGKKCYATYVSRSPDSSLIGFNISCNSHQK
ncbi:hypothetical protein [Zoogloea sp.]|uniref:hypothetical protein n=1 Tax=Zoogloea sp. TaxID=49181 RepID=UPI0035B17B1B